MRVPFRFNRAGWNLPIPSRFSFPDPRRLIDSPGLDSGEFSQLISTLRSGNTCKSTRPGRHVQSDAMLIGALNGSSPTLLDIGASDGSTSLDLIHSLCNRYAAFYVTDRTLAVDVVIDRKGRTHFHDEIGTCFLVATSRWLRYPSAPGARSWPFMQVECSGEVRSVALVQPRLLELSHSDPRIRLRAHDIFEPWNGEKVDAIKVANLLNRTYFPDAKIHKALQNVWSALSAAGLFLVVDNRDREKSSLYMRTSAGFRLIGRVNDGTEIDELVQSAAP